MVTECLGDSAAGLHSLRHPGKKGGEVRAILESLGAETGAAVHPIGCMTSKAKGARHVTAGGKTKAMAPGAMITSKVSERPQ
jgi:hypothetical protein